MPREEAATFQFIWCLIWKPRDSNFWVKNRLGAGVAEMTTHNN